MKYFDYFTGELTTKRKQRKRVIKELKKISLENGIVKGV